MATHSRILASEIPWTEEFGGLQPMESQRVWHDLATKQQICNLSVQFSCSVMSNSCATPWTVAHQASLSITNSQSFLMSIELVMPSSHLILCHPLLLLPSISPSIRVFSNELALHIRWPKYSSFSFNISPCNEHSGLISFRMDWLDLLAVQGTVKSLLQHHSSKASIFQYLAFFIVQLSYPTLLKRHLWQFLEVYVFLSCLLLKGVFNLLTQFIQPSAQQK